MWTATRSAIAALVLALGSDAAAAPVCKSGVFEDVPYSYCLADPEVDDIRLWHIAPDGYVFGTFDRLDGMLRSDGQRLAFAMNGGMYHDDRSPVGHYVEAGRETAPLITSPGPGNFGMLPNGVFCLTDTGARVIETLRFRDQAPACRFASQSGPLMVADGALHPRFLPDSSSKFIRNGIGVRPDGIVVFAISDAAVNFHRFARLFRDALGTPDALYMDGKVSRLFAPGLDRHDIGFPIGPIVGVTIPAE